MGCLGSLTNSIFGFSEVLSFITPCSSRTLAHLIFFSFVDSSELELHDVTRLGRPDAVFYKFVFRPLLTLAGDSTYLDHLCVIETLLSTCMPALLLYL